MKSLFILPILLMLGCANAPPPANNLVGKPLSMGITAFGTLSDSDNPTDMAASAVYTHLAMYRFMAAKKLRAGIITVNEAISAQNFADGIRSRLDKSVAKKDILAIKQIFADVDIEFNKLEKRQ